MLFLWTRYRAVQSGSGASSARPLWSSMSGSSAPDLRMSKFAPAGELTTFAIVGRYGGSAPDALNGAMSGVIDASEVDGSGKILRHRVR
ncbi:MAG: hypothetical protein DMF93_18345 [Acidobacteria bacterium]|nr:MAG: hypothetical protein DMF93_18345 [Acidobacteriota bacterium]